MANVHAGTGHAGAESDMPPDAQGDAIVHEGVVVPTRGARLWSLAAIVTAVAAIWFIVPGIVGMVCGSVAHLKGDRWGLPTAGLAGVTTIVGMALLFFTRLT